MAFVLHQTWDARSPCRGAGEASSGSIFPTLSRTNDRLVRKGGATALTILVHLLLLWLFVSRLAGNVGAAEPADAAAVARGSLTIFALSEFPAAASAPSDPRPALEQSLALAKPSLVDTTVATDLPPEWSVSRLPPAPRPVEGGSPAPAASSAAATGQSPTTGAASGRGGMPGYDPYAGAAPMYREAGAQAHLAAFPDRLTLDEAALESIRRAIAASLPGRRGTAELVVRVSPNGLVLEAKAKGGSAPAEARNALGRALVGKRLYRGTASDAQTLALPVLSLG